jgi:HD superfamily phosphohydrolase
MSAHKTWPYEEILKQLQERYEKEGLSDYWDAERAAIEVALKAIASNLPDGRFSPHKVLGVGGSGVVLQLADELFPKVDKALKFPRPVPGKVHLVREMLGKEIAFLAELRHPGIVGIEYYKTLPDIETYEDLPFYVMEFVNGAPSKEFIKRAATNEKSFNTIFHQTAKILAYLHTAPTSFAHLDIKPDNILVTAAGRPVVIDLGTCKRLLSDDVQTTIACTKSFAHPQLVRRLAEDPTDDNRSKGELSRSEIDPRWDLWALGLTLLDWLGVDFDSGTVAENAMYQRLNTYTRKYYMLLAARLLNSSPRAWLNDRVGITPTFLSEFTINSSVELSEILARLDGTGEPISQIPELSSKSSRTIQAAPNNHVPCTPALTKVLEHRLYQRLNSITQLGFVSQVYPGAKHSRREHSLGTYANTAQILRALYNDAYSPLFRQIVTEEDCRTVLLASLIHDIGHFPLGHELEEIDKKIFSHAELTLAMIRGEWKKKKRGSQVIKFEPLDEVFKAWRTTPDRVIDILSAKPGNASATRKNKLLRSFFSGPLDADKMDYLLRDARNTDVPYPLGIDIDRLFQCLTIVIVPKIPGGAREVPTIGVHSKGKVAAEFLTLARYAMFSQVYWHHAVRAQKAMLFRAIEALIAKLMDEATVEQFKSEYIAMVAALPEVLYQDNPKTLFPDVYKAGTFDLGTVEFGTDLAPTDAAVLSWVRERLRRESHPNSTLIDGILSRNLYKRLWVVSYEMEQERWDKITGAWEQLDRAKRNRVSLEFERNISKLLTPNRTTSVTALKAEEAREKIDEYVAGQRPWLLIDIPSNRPGAEVGLFCVQEGQRRQLRKDDRVVGDLQSSRIWESYARDLRQAAGKIRIFCDPALVDTVESSIPWETGIEALEDVLGQSTL